jgi:hypothetical protein
LLPARPFALRACLPPPPSLLRLRRGGGGGKGSPRPLPFLPDWFPPMFIASRTCAINNLL